MATKSRTYTIARDNKILFSFTVEVDENCDYTDFQWDSKTGLVTALSGGKRVVVPHEGNSLGSITPGPFETNGMKTIEYSFLYH